MSFLSDVKTELGKLKQDDRAILKFGVTMAVVLALIGLVMFFKGHHSERAYWFWTGGGLFLVLGFAAPAALRPVYKLWMGLAFVLGWFVSRLILSLLFYLVLTPIGLVLRLRGNDLLDQRIDKKTSTYWVKRPKTEMSTERYKRLF